MSTDQGDIERSSWIPLTNHTPDRQDFSRLYSDYGDEELDWGELVQRGEDLHQQVQLTSQDGRNLRDDVLIPNNGAVLPADMGFAVEQFEEYVDEKEDTFVVLEEEYSGMRARFEQSHRFEQQYMKNYMGKFYAVEREAKQRWGEEGLTMVMITLSASVFDEDDELLPPVDHLDSIMDPDRGSWRAVRTALGRAVGDKGWEYARILEPHTPDKGTYASAGYCHVHLGVFINDPDEDVEADDFSGVLSSHVGNCETAGEGAHTVANSVSVERYDSECEGGMGAYLTAYLGDQLEESIEDADPHMKRYMATLWASGRRRVSFSNGAQEWIREDKERVGDEWEDHYKDDDGDDSDGAYSLSELFGWLHEHWVFVGVEVGIDGAPGEYELFECESGNSGGSHMGEVRFPTVQTDAMMMDIDKEVRQNRFG